MSDEVWVLQRGHSDPVVWPFQTEQQAADFALEHGLLDWRAQRHDDSGREHEAVCGRDGEPWPCRHVRVEQRAQGIIAAAANRCARCGKQIGWLKVTFRGAGELGDDVSYHGKLGACFNDAKRRAEQTGDERALADIARCEASREYARRLREARAAA